MTASLGVAVIGAGNAGRAHAAAYRAVVDTSLPDIRLVSIGDINDALGSAMANRYGYSRNDTTWQSIAAAPDIDVVSVVVANSLHREIVEGLLTAGKHVLCEKPLSDTLADARAMADAARVARPIARVGFTFRRAPGIAYIRDLVQSGKFGSLLHISGRYWSDYAGDVNVPMSWRFEGGPGSGALADVGSHLSYLAEFIAGDIRSVSGGRLSTVIDRRPVAVGVVSGRGAVELTEEWGTVRNDDYAAFSATFDQGVGSFEVSRIATGHPNTLTIEAFFEHGSVTYDHRRPAEVGLLLKDGDDFQRGFRQVVLFPGHPYISGRFTIDSAGAGFNGDDNFTLQARAFLQEVAGLSESESLPRCATFDEGVHNMALLEAVVESALAGGATVSLPNGAEVLA
jgi:Predicted dehydrogenases and related proteins